MTTTVTVSPMRADECDVAAELMQQVIEPLGYYNARARSEELAKYQPDELKAAIDDDPLSVLLARDQERVVGFCVSKYDDGVIWLSWFGAEAESRGKGVGCALLEALAATLEARRAHKVWCDTRTENVESEGVLKRMGFRKLVELRNHWYGQDFFLWEWYPK